MIDGAVLAVSRVWREYGYRDYRLFPDQLARMRAVVHP